MADGLEPAMNATVNDFLNNFYNMLTQTNKDYLELTEQQYDYIELLLTTALQEWKLQGMDIAKGIYDPS